MGRTINTDHLQPFKNTKASKVKNGYVIIKHSVQSPGTILSLIAELKDTRDVLTIWQESRESHSTIKKHSNEDNTQQKFNSKTDKEDTTYPNKRTAKINSYSLLES